MTATRQISIKLLQRITRVSIVDTDTIMIFGESEYRFTVTCAHSTHTRKNKNKKQNIDLQNDVQHTATSVREACQREAPTVPSPAAHAEADEHGHCSTQADHRA